jgi:hypothetical protein
LGKNWHLANGPDDSNPDQVASDEQNEEWRLS